MIDKPSRFFKGDPDSHAEYCVRLADLNEQQRIAFIAEAQKHGFTEVQARFLASQLSLVSHVHEYYHDLHDYTSSPQIDSEFVSEYVRNGGGKRA